MNEKPSTTSPPSPVERAPKPRVVLVGGSGFLGNELALRLAERYELVILTRRPKPSAIVRAARWDGKTLGSWTRELEGAFALVNFTGKNVDCRYTRTNRREILESRIDAVEVLGKAIAGLDVPPQSWVQCSTTAQYIQTDDAFLDETAEPARTFSPNVAKAWEAAFRAQHVPATRKVILRTSFALGRTGGALSRLEKLARAFLGGATGSGRQWISWIHIEDLCEMFRWSIERPLEGIYHATAPNPVRNKDFMRELRRVLHRPWSPPVPAPIVALGARLMGTEAELALRGRRCIPRRFLDEGFVFRFPQLREALENLYNYSA